MISYFKLFSSGLSAKYVFFLRRKQILISVWCAFLLALAPGVPRIITQAMVAVRAAELKAATFVKVER